MKKILKKVSALMLLYIFYTISPTLAADIVNLPTESIKGKFYSVTEGLVVLDQKGIKKKLYQG